MEESENVEEPGVGCDEYGNEHAHWRKERQCTVKKIIPPDPEFWDPDFTFCAEYRNLCLVL